LVNEGPNPTQASKPVTTLETRLAGDASGVDCTAVVTAECGTEATGDADIWVVIAID